MNGATLKRAVALIVLSLALAAPAAADKKGNRAPRLRGVKARAVEAATSDKPDTPDTTLPGRKPRALDFSRDTRAEEDQKTEQKIADQRRGLIKEIDALLAKAGPKYSARPDRLLQKAELQWEESRYQHHLALEKYSAEDEAAGKPEPLPNYAEAEKTYHQILEDHPDFVLADEVRFHLGFSLAEEGDGVGAIAVLEELVKKHPTSDFVPETRVALGELFFAKDMLEDAATQFRTVVERSPKHGLAPFARYKLGWTYYRLHKYDDAIKEMVGAIEDEAGHEVKMSIRDQALGDLIIVWAERPESWRDAASYYEQKGGDAMLRRELLRYAKYLVAQGKGEEALALCTWLTERDATRPETLDYDTLRWRVIEIARNAERVETEAARIADFYAGGAAWDKAAGRTAAQRSEARELGERALLFAATLRHETAQRTTDAASYQAAQKNYKLYLARYPDGEFAAQSQWGLAEVTFQLGDELGAGAAYVRATDRVAPEMREEAAYKAVFAYAAAVRKAGLADDATCNAVDDPRQPPPAPIELNDAEKGLIAAVDRFNQIAPQSPDGPEVAFMAGRVLWLRLHFDEASARFTRLVDAWPKTPPAGDAAALALDCYNRAHRWSDLVLWARRMINEKRFEQFDEKALRETIAGASAQAAVELETRGDPAGAARVLVGVVDDNPKSQRNPDRLLAAATLYGRAGARREAEVTYRRLLDKYDKTEQAGKAAFALGTLYESRGDLLRAAAAYEKAADLAEGEDKTGGKAADALFNAATLRDTLGEGKKAAALFDRYGKDFAERDDAPEIALRAAEALENSGNLDDAQSRYAGFAKKWPKAAPAILLEAEARACSLSARSSPAQAKKSCAATLAAAKKSGASKVPGSPGAAAAARVQLALAEIAEAEMEAVKLELPEKVLIKRFDEKLARFAEVMQAYLAVSDFGAPVWGARAIVGLGMSYQHLARSMREAPLPPSLSADPKLAETAIEEYRAQIEVRAGQYDEAALDMFGRVADLAREGIVTPATAAAAAARRAVDTTQDPWLGEAPATAVEPVTLGGDPW